MRLVRSVLRLASLFFGWPGRAREKSGAVSILMYHRVTGDVGLELDLPFEQFAQQMAILAETGCVVSLSEAIEGLKNGWSDERLRYVLTFDDAYEDFYTHALPVLEKYGLPATLYVPTGFIDSSEFCPVKGELAGKQRLTPASWDMLRDIAAHELITIGAHTHTHPDLPDLSDVQIAEELDRCDTLLRERLGVDAQHFAYPRGVWDGRVREIVAPRYGSVIRADGGLARYGETAVTDLPRIPVQRSDGMRWFRRRIAGELAFEENAIAFAKRWVRASGYWVRAIRQER